MAPAQALTYLVGADSFCNFNNIQAAINAAQNNPGPDTIRIAGNQSYTGLALKIGGQDLAMEGGYTSCFSQTPIPGNRTTLSGQGASADSVIEFSGNGTRSLRSIDVTDGDEPASGAGGGVFYDGAGELALEDCFIGSNRAGFGGGINFHGRSAGALLTIGTGTIISNNVASQSGGGIRVTGNADLLMLAPSTVLSNRALGLESSEVGHGGGILIVAPAGAEIASPGITGVTIGNNEARYGGGLAVLVPDDSATVLLTATDPQRPVSIVNNIASAEGGGIYVGGNAEAFGLGFATVCPFRYRIDNNEAAQGAAVMLKEVGSFDRNWCLNPVPCASGEVCNSMNGNRSELGDVPTAGATVFVNESEYSFAKLFQVSLLNNHGGSLIRGAVGVEHALVASNVTTGPLAVLNTDHPTQASFWVQVTATDNSIGANHVFETGMPLELKGSIIHQPGKDAVLLNGGSVEAQRLLVDSCVSPLVCNAINQVEAIPSSGPRFWDPEGGDYRLHPASIAADYAPSSAGVDLDGNPRNRDLVFKPNRFGAGDLGAYERQSMGNLVRNGEFIEHVRLWKESPTPDAELTYETNGATTSGALRVADTENLLIQEVMARQCVPLPGPGRYKVDGRARVDPALPGPSNGPDRVKIRWRYFPFTSDACTGQPAQTGELLFPSSSVFALPLNPADGFFDVFAVGESSKVEIQLIAAEGSTSLVGSTAGYFDDVSLTVNEAPAAIFSSGFEAAE